MSLFLDDHSRVVLKSVRDIAGSDYINANYVDVSYFSFRPFTTIIINDIYPGSFTHPKVVFREVMHPIKLEFGNVGFEESGKPENPEENLSERSKEPTTNLTLSWLRVPN